MGCVSDMAYIRPYVHAGWGITVGGFYIGRFQASQVGAVWNDDNPNVADNTDPGAFPAISQAGVPPWCNISLLQARKACANAGVGWHLITAHEWAIVAEWSRLNGTMPHGNNGNVNPPADVTFTTETAVVDQSALARNATYYRCLTGTGPNTWSHNHRADGIFDMDGNVWGWNEGLFLLPANQNDNSATPHVITGAGGAGYCLVLASLNTAQVNAPYGASTSVAANALTDTNKAWTVNAFQSGATKYFLYDVAGSLFYIDSNSATALTIDGTPVAGAYSILKLVETNITTGSTSGQKILTLQAGALAPFAIPATTDGTGSATYGNDGYWFDTAALRACLRGGDWANGTYSGVFATALNNVPTNTNVYIGFRLARSV